jgi:DNA-binding MarR family transcriptional regulator
VGDTTKKTEREQSPRTRATAGQAPLAWYDVLLELERAGDSLRIGELGERLVVEPHNVTRLVDRLETEGLLKRRRASEDGRGVFAVLTDKCAALRKGMWPHYRGAILKVFAAALSTREAEALSAAVKSIITHLRRPRLADTAKSAGPRAAQCR